MLKNSVRQMSYIVLGLFLAVVSIASDQGRSVAGGRRGWRSLTLQEMEDKVRGGWAGQMVGVTYGAPTEFQFMGKINEAPRDWKPEELKGALGQDDLYVEMTFAEVMDRIGLDATTEQYGEAFRDSKYGLWAANFAARRLLRRGVVAPASGHNLHANDIDFQIESDFIGLMCPGLPRAAQYYAERVGHVMNYGDGVYGGVFLSAMYAAAFFERDPRKVVAAGAAAIPAKSVYGQVIHDVLRWSEENSDWKRTWQLIEDKWGKADVCPDGALRPSNIDASLNGAYVALGLLYGRGDFAKTMEISMRAGQDSDCNPSSAAGVLGVILGYRGIPAQWTAPLAPIADEKFSYTNYSFNTIVSSTIARAKLVVERAGGKVSEKEFEIPEQKPRKLRLEQFAPGKPVERITLDDPRWTLRGTWEKVAGPPPEARAKTPGAEATVVFKGTGAMFVGSFDSNRGTADLHLDGKSVGTIDGYSDGGNRATEGLWGKFDLRPGTHHLRVVAKGQPYPGSKGAWVYLEDIIVFRK